MELSLNDRKVSTYHDSLKDDVIALEFFAVESIMELLQCFVNLVLFLEFLSVLQRVLWVDITHILLLI